MISKDERKWLEKKYGHLYKRSTIHDLQRCAYCDFRMQLYDHVPAISLLKNVDIEKSIKKGQKFILYPSCVMCNAILGNKDINDYLKRLEFLFNKYDSKLKKIEIWTDDEINSLGYSLRTQINHTMSKAKIYSLKLYNIDLKMLRYIDIIDELY